MFNAWRLWSIVFCLVIIFDFQCNRWRHSSAFLKLIAVIVKTASLSLEERENVEDCVRQTKHENMTRMGECNSIRFCIDLCLFVLNSILDYSAVKYFWPS